MKQPSVEQQAKTGSTFSSHSLILAIDNGTQSVRAMLFNQTGDMLAIEKVPLQAYDSDQVGYAEQDADYFWQNVVKACQQLWQQAKVRENGYQQQVKAITVTSQRGTIIHLDQQGKPLRKAIIWLDQRRTPLADCPKISPFYHALFRVLGQKSAVEYFQSQAEVNWVAAKQPEIHANTHKVLLLSAYLNYQLTGKFIDSAGSTVGYLPFDYKQQNWCKPADWKWQALAVSREQLPELVKPSEYIGTVQSKVAQLIGVSAETPVIASASDKACEVLGSGCISNETASLSYGTTATINTNNQKFITPQAFIPAFPSAVNGQFNTEVMIYRGFWMVNWFKQEFAQAEIAQAKQLGVHVEALFDELLQQVPAGSQGLMLQPYWSPGIKNLEAKGAIVGFGDVHTRAHIYRAILEGLAYALKEGMQRIEKRQKKKITRIIVSGGGSQSDAAMQLTADIFNLPASRPHTHETSGLGAAINVAVGLGWYENYQQAVKAMTRLNDSFFPQAENAALYQALYQNIYLQLYQRLKPIYQSLSTILKN